MRGLLGLISAPVAKTAGVIAALAVPVGVLAVGAGYVLDAPEEDPSSGGSAASSPLIAEADPDPNGSGFNGSVSPPENRGSPEGPDEPTTTTSSASVSEQTTSTATTERATASNSSTTTTSGNSSTTTAETTTTSHETTPTSHETTTTTVTETKTSTTVTTAASTTTIAKTPVSAPELAAPDPTTTTTSTVPPSTTTTTTTSNSEGKAPPSLDIPSTTTTTTTTPPPTTTTTTTAKDSEPEPRQSGKVSFPSDAGLINVKTEYGARGDGVTDDTAAIRKAIRENVGDQKTLYFPAGTYIVSDSLEWRDQSGNWQPWLSFQGQGPDHTVIKLKNGASGFGNPSSPKGVIVTASGLFAGSPTGGGRDHYGKGEGNEAFMNYVYDLTVDTGRGNAGAVGIDFLSNNSGAVVNVTIRSGDRKGAAGLGMTRKWPGPSLIKNVRIEGFDYGVKTAYKEYGITFENLVLVNQRIAGIRNDSNVLSIRRLTSSNSVPAIQNTSPLGMVVLLDSSLKGGSSNVSAIENEGELYVRNVDTSGYRSAIAGQEGTSVSEYSTHDSFTSLGLTVRSTPVPAWAGLSDWANVQDSAYAGGANPYDRKDDTAAIQAALNSGRSTIYFPSAGMQGEGRYLVTKTIVIPPSVERIIGFGSYIAPGFNHEFGSSSNPKPLFRTHGGSSGQVVTFERFRMGRHNTEGPGAIWIEHDSKRTLVLKHVMAGGGFLGFRGKPGSGRVFFEDWCCAAIEFDRTAGVWARQLNIESFKLMVDNTATPLWVLGIKTERPATVIDTSSGGKSEVLGGLVYPVNEVPKSMAAFIAKNAKHSLVYAVSAYGGADHNYVIQAQETQNGKTTKLLTKDVLDRGSGSLVFR